MRGYRDWLLTRAGRPRAGDAGADLDRLPGLEPGDPGRPRLDAFAVEGVTACCQGPIGIGPPDPEHDRGRHLPVLVNRGDAGWAIALPYWGRSFRTAVSTVLRAADLYHGGKIGDRSLRPHSWAVYPLASAPTLP